MKQIPNAAGAHSQKKRVFASRPHRCQLCGYDKIVHCLTVHHVDRNRSNGKPENLMLLCWNCHMEIHYKEKTGPYCQKKVRWTEFADFQVLT